MSKEICFKIRSLVGAVTPYWQSGWRTTLPKKMTRLYNIRRGKDPPTFVLIETDKGIWLRPLPDIIQDEEMHGVMGFLGMPTISRKDLEALLSELEEKE